MITRDAPAELLDLALDVGASVHGHGVEPGRLGQGLEHLTHLDGGSRVGTSTSALGRPRRGGGDALVRWSSGTPNASVLPEPVLALPQTSRPARASSTVMAWMANGAWMPCSSSAATMAGSSSPVSPLPRPGPCPRRALGAVLARCYGRPRPSMNDERELLTHDTLTDPSDRAVETASGPIRALAPDKQKPSPSSVRPRHRRRARGAGHPRPVRHPGHDVEDALAGRDVCGKAKTGSGKTLHSACRCSSAPRRPVHRAGSTQALVLVPTRELAVQVSEVFEPLAEAAGLHTVAVYGGADIERQIKKLRRGVDVIIATPGRLIDLGDRGELSVADLETLVLDEADRMADMASCPRSSGYSVASNGTTRPCCFSATLDGAVDRLVSRYMTDPVLHEVASPTTTVEAWSTASSRSTRWTASRCARPSAAAPTRSWCSSAPSTAATDWSSSWARRRPAGAIHGDLRQAQRERTLKDFTRGSSTYLWRRTWPPGLHIDASTS